jgi:hypothetical protein
MKRRIPERRLTDRCMRRAFTDTVDDDSRLLLERAAREMQRLRKICLRLSRACENN